eukprot:GHVQ01030106.1.p1 GENE.GHVQ01030106.1~~GHVQ01030106.1.p1  ORF type:complete len:251 (+),score=32.99 GHVQ01030106.1:460-1212(+)
MMDCQIPNRGWRLISLLHSLFILSTLYSITVLGMHNPDETQRPDKLVLAASSNSESQVTGRSKTKTPVAPTWRVSSEFAGGAGAVVLEMDCPHSDCAPVDPPGSFLSSLQELIYTKEKHPEEYKKIQEELKKMGYKKPVDKLPPVDKKEQVTADQQHTSGISGDPKTLKPRQVDRPQDSDSDNALAPEYSAMIEELATSAPNNSSLMEPLVSFMASLHVGDIEDMTQDAPDGLQRIADISCLQNDLSELN